MINLKETLENLDKAIKELSEYFVSEDGELAIISGDIVIYHTEKEKLERSGFRTEILDHCIWETKDFTMFGLWDNETGDYNMIFDNSKKIEGKDKEDE